MTIEAGVAVTAALLAGSVALLGFGLDSLIELASASIVIWRFMGARGQSDAAERRAQQLIAACFVALALYLLYDGIHTLADGAHPITSWPGVAVSLAAIIVMPVLVRAKRRVAAQLESRAVAGDAAQSRLCALASAGVLVSLLANAALAWWWLDPIIGFGISGLAVHEARTAWAGESCCDCAPVGLDTAASVAGDAITPMGDLERNAAGSPVQWSPPSEGSRPTDSHSGGPGSPPPTAPPGADCRRCSSGR